MAFERLLRVNERLARRVAFLIVRDAGEAEDTIQDAFFKAWRALRRFDPERPFRPWLLAIVANEARNRLRSGGRRDRLALRLVTEPSGDAVPSPEGHSLASERRRALLDAVDALPDEQRLTVMARYFLELSENETAEMLGIAPGTVKSRLSRALERLRPAAEAFDA